jgi:hypothetical protein
VLAYGFTENRQLAAKIDRNSVILGRDPHIPDRLCIMVLYMSFYGFSKFSNFHSKSISAYSFTKNRQFAVKNDWNSVFISRDPSYSPSVIHKCSVYEFSKFSIFSQNPYMLAYGFKVNHQFAAKTDRNSIFFRCDLYIPDQLYTMVMYMSFYGFLKF